MKSTIIRSSEAREKLETAALSLSSGESGVEGCASSSPQKPSARARGTSERNQQTEDDIYFFDAMEYEPPNNKLFKARATGFKSREYITKLENKILKRDRRMANLYRKCQRFESVIEDLFSILETSEVPCTLYGHLIEKFNSRDINEANPEAGESHLSEFMNMILEIFFAPRSNGQLFAYMMLLLRSQHVAQLQVRPGTFSYRAEQTFYYIRAHPGTVAPSDIRRMLGDNELTDEAIEGVVSGFDKPYSHSDAVYVAFMQYKYARDICVDFVGGTLTNRSLRFLQEVLSTPGMFQTYSHWTHESYGSLVVSDDEDQPWHTAVPESSPETEVEFFDTEQQGMPKPKILDFDLGRIKQIALQLKDSRQLKRISASLQQVNPGEYEVSDTTVQDYQDYFIEIAQKIIGSIIIVKDEKDWNGFCQKLGGIILVGTNENILKKITDAVSSSFGPNPESGFDSVRKGLSEIKNAFQLVSADNPAIIAFRGYLSAAMYFKFAPPAFLENLHSDDHCLSPFVKYQCDRARESCDLISVVNVLFQAIETTLDMVGSYSSGIGLKSFFSPNDVLVQAVELLGMKTAFLTNHLEKDHGVSNYEYGKRIAEVSRNLGRMISNSNLFKDRKILLLSYSERLQELESIVCAKVSIPTLRRQALCVVAYGQPGCGKTKFTDDLAKIVDTALGHKFKRTSICYTDIGEEKFESAYRPGQRAIIMDEVAACKNSPNDKTEEMFKVLSYVNNTPKFLQRANEKEKGNIVAEPNFVGITTNKQNINIHQTAFCPEAFDRRILFVELVVKPEARLIVQGVETGGIDRAKAVAMTARKVCPQEVVVYHFQKVKPTKKGNKVGYKRVDILKCSVDEFYRWFHQRAVKHFADQEAFLKATFSSDNFRVCPKCGFGKITTDGLCLCSPTGNFGGASSPPIPPSELAVPESLVRTDFIMQWLTYCFSGVNGWVYDTLTSSLREYAQAPARFLLFPQLDSLLYGLFRLCMRAYSSFGLHWLLFMLLSWVCKFWHYCHRATVVLALFGYDGSFYLGLWFPLPMPIGIDPEVSVLGHLILCLFMCLISLICMQITNRVSKAITRCVVRDIENRWITRQQLIPYASRFIAVLAILNVIKGVIKFGSASKVIPESSETGGSLNPTTQEEVDERQQKENHWERVERAFDDPSRQTELSMSSIGFQSLNAVNKNFVLLEMDVYKKHKTVLGLPSLKRKPEITTIQSYAIFLNSRVLLVHLHFIKEYLPLITSETCPAMRCYNNFQAMTTSKQPLHFSSYVVQDDFVYLFSTSDARKSDILGYLPEHRPSGSCPGVLELHRDGIPRVHKVMLNCGPVSHRSLPHQVHGGTYKQVSFETQVGDCMTPICRQDSPGYIAGFHSAGYDNGEFKSGIFFTITRREADAKIEELLKSAAEVGIMADAVPQSDCGVITSIGLTEEVNVEILQNIHPKTCSEWIQADQEVPTRGMKVYGECPTMGIKPHTNVLLTDLSKDLELSGWKREHGAPRHNARIAHREFFQKSLKGMLSIPHARLMRAVDDYVTPLISQLKLYGPKYPRRTLTIMEALNGIPGCRSIKRAKLDTASGLGWSGKKIEHVEVEQTPTGNLYKPTPPLLEAVNSMMDKLRSGIFFNVISRTACKDEPITFEKIASRKQRVFCVFPMEFFLCGKMLFASIVNFLYSFPIVAELAQGVNCVNSEWSEVYEHVLKPNEEQCLAGDFSRYDICLSGQMIRAVAAIIERLARAMDFPEEDILAMSMYLTILANHLWLFNGLIITWDAINGSGNWLTILINGLCNSLLHRLAFFAWLDRNRLITDDPNRNKDFRSNVCLMSMGDDSAGSTPHETFNMIFLQGYFAELNIKYTAADKGSEIVPFLHASEVSFCKRMWRWSERFSCYMAPLSVSSIGKSLHCQMKTEDRAASTIGNIYNAIIELSRHEKEVYDTHMQYLRAAIEMSETFSPDQIDPLYHTWELAQEYHTRYFEESQETGKADAQYNEEEAVLRLCEELEDSAPSDVIFL